MTGPYNEGWPMYVFVVGVMAEYQFRKPWWRRVPCWFGLHDWVYWGILPVAYGAKFMNRICARCAKRDTP